MCCVDCEAGADGFMTKDRDPEEIIGRVRRVLARTAPDEGKFAARRLPRPRV